MMTASELRSILRCPRCRSRVVTGKQINLEESQKQKLYCTSFGCVYASRGFPIVGEQPILIDFEASIIDEAKLLADNARSIIARDHTGMRLRTQIRRFMFGKNRIAEIYCTRFIEAVKAQSRRPRVLVIGGGQIGSGATILYSEPNTQLVGIDVYASPYTLIVADAHHLPFEDGTFDGVWIQAVLEHVLDPDVVVSEIHRVLAPNGVVYADTPFMQQVHEGAFDFTRFTLSGHRWLFRKFHHISSGSVSGAGTALVWSVRYFVRALTGSDRIASLVSIGTFWLRYLDRVTKRRPNSDAACGVFFFGARADSEISPKSMIQYYEQQT
jgi:SAM-dependent methyltransferase